jgi:hypothetical protein
MKSTILIAAAIAVGGCSVGKAESGGASISRSFPVGAFDRIEVAGPFDVAVTTGGQPAVNARGSAKLVEKMVVEVEGSTLKIHPEKRSGWFSGGFNWKGDHAKVTVSVPALVGAAIAGSGDVRIDKVGGRSFAGEIAGSGNLNLGEVRVQDLELTIAGSGKAEAAGQAAQSRYEIAGSGDIEAGRVASQDTRAEIAGSGNIAANARQTARVDIAGSGNVRVTGGAKCSISKAGSGNVECS